MSSVTDNRTMNDRRSYDTFHSFNVPSGRRWAERRDPVKPDHASSRPVAVAATVVFGMLLFLVSGILMHPAL